MDTQNKDTVTLLVNGVAHENWTHYRVDSDLQTTADAFSVTLGLKRVDFDRKINPGDDCVLQVNGTNVMVGIIDDISYSIDASSRTLEVSGRDRSSILLDSSAPIVSAKELTLEQVVDLIVKPFGFSRIKVNVTGARTKKVQINPGATAWSVLEQAADAYGVAIWFDPDGTLVISEPDYSVQSASTLMLNSDGRTNILSMSAKYSQSESYSEITVLGQSGASAKNNIKSIANDGTVRKDRTLIIVDADCETEDAASKRAQKALADARLASFSLDVEVVGFYTDAEKTTLWTPGQRVHIESDVFEFDEIFFLMSRTFSGGHNQSNRTQLKFVRDKSWVILDKNEKAAARRGGAGKKKPGLGIVDVTK